MDRWSSSWEILVAELSKCQLLCKSCHLEKSVKEGSLSKAWDVRVKPQHGTYHTYAKYKCRCDACMAAKRANVEKYKKRKQI